MYDKLRNKSWFAEILNEEKMKYEMYFEQYLRPD